MATGTTPSCRLERKISYVVFARLIRGSPSAWERPSKTPRSPAHPRETLRVLLDLVPHASCIADLEGSIIVANDSFAARFSHRHGKFRVGDLEAIFLDWRVHIDKSEIEVHVGASCDREGRWYFIMQRVLTLDDQTRCALFVISKAGAVFGHATEAPQGVMPAPPPREHPKPPTHGLTAREQEVLERVLAGDTTARIASRLMLSTKTVEVYRSSILRKMRVKNCAQLGALFK